MIIVGGTAKQLGVLSKKKWWKKRKRRENSGHWFYCHFGTYLEHFLESILYILYTISNLGKSEVQRFKRCPNQSWKEKVMVISRKLSRVKRKFRTVRIKVRKISHSAKPPAATRVPLHKFIFIFAWCETTCKKFFFSETTCKIFFFSKTTSESGGTCETTSEKANQLAKIHPSCENQKSKFAWLLFLVRNGFAQCKPPLCHTSAITSSSETVSHSAKQGAKNFARCEFECENQNMVQKFRTLKSKVRKILSKVRNFF